MQVDLKAAIGAALCTVAVVAAPVWAQAQAGAAASQDLAVGQVGATIVCGSKPGENRVCLADTSAGVVLNKATGTTDCILGKTWGYDEAGV